MVAMLLFYGRTDSPAAWLYVAMHGGYGLFWVLKSAIFPDKRWEKDVPLWYGVFGVWGALSLYWIGGWMVMRFNPDPPAWYPALAVLIYALGVFFHFGSDMQKHTRLASSPGLITDGFFRLSRNPNYFGELLIYCAFGMLAMSWIPFAVIALWVLSYWVPGMIRKDRSLSRHEGFAEYKKEVKMFIPFVI
jgi:steroid 5-alpha reductase family enzyme